MLVVTPVIFFWLRERRLGLQHELLPESETARMTVRRLVLVAAVVAAVVGGALTLRRLWQPGTDETTADAAGGVVQTVESGDLEIVLLSPSGTLRAGRNTFTFEFRSDGRLVDVGTVRAAANMPMPGMVMSGNLQVSSAGVPGRYTATAEFGMAGAWQMSIEWDGRAGRGSVSFEGTVE